MTDKLNTSVINATERVRNALNSQGRSYNFSITGVSEVGYSDEITLSWRVYCYGAKVESHADTLEAAVDKFIEMLVVQLGTPMCSTHYPALEAPDYD